MSLFQPDQRDSYIQSNPSILVHDAILLEASQDHLKIQSAINPASVSTVPNRLVQYNGEQYDPSYFTPNTRLKVFINVEEQTIEKIELSDTIIYTVVVDNILNGQIIGKYSHHESLVTIKIPIEKVRSSHSKISMIEGDILKLYKTGDKFTMVELKENIEYEEEKVEEEPKAVEPRKSINRASIEHSSILESVDRSIGKRQSAPQLESMEINQPVQMKNLIPPGSQRESHYESMGISQPVQMKNLIPPGNQREFHYGSIEISQPVQMKYSIPPGNQREFHYGSIEINQPVQMKNSIPPGNQKESQYGSMEISQPVQMKNLIPPGNQKEPRITPCIESLIEEKITTIGKERLPIESLQLVYKYNELFVENAKMIGNSYTSWRRVRGDGNCYYRAVGVALLEHFCRYTTPFDELELFIYKLENDHAYRVRDINIYLRDQFIIDLKKLLAIIKDSKSALEILQGYLEDKDFDYSLIVEMRAIAANNLEDNQNSPELQNYLFEGIDPIIHNISQVGNEAEGVEFRLMSEGLGAYIKHVSIFDDQTYIFSPSTKSRAPLLHILYKQGHYDLLYTSEQNFIDKYNQGSYIFDSYPLSEDELFTFSDKMYMTFEEFQELNKPKELPDKTVDVLVNYCTDLQDHLLKTYECLLALNRQFKFNLHSVPEMNSIVQYWTQYTPISSKAKDIRNPQLLTTIQQNETNLMTFIQSKELSILLFSKCSICNNKPIDFTLGCGHGGCHNDLSMHIQRSTDDKVIFHKYENSKSVLCPKCGYIIPEQEIIDILGQDIFSYYHTEMLNRQHKFETTNSIKECLLCHEVNHLENFPKSHMCCCYNCHGLMITKSIKKCMFCSSAISKDFTSELKERVYTCTACGDFMKLNSLKDSIDCPDHLLCKLCVLKSVEIKKCVKCERKLSRNEMDRVNGEYYKVCSICREGFEEENLFKDKVCDCVICIGCYSRAVEKGTSRCPTCKTPFDEKDITCCECLNRFDADGLYKLICDHKYCKKCLRSALRTQMKQCKEILVCMKCQEPVDTSLLYELVNGRKIERYYSRIYDEAPTEHKKHLCAICLEDFKIDDMRELNCNHAFCENCIRDHAEFQVKENTMVNGITCPQCHEIVDGIIIESILSREMFEKYSLFIIRKNMKLARCPKCESEFECDRRLAKCMNCKYSFCVRCSQESHAEDCDESAIRRLIESFLAKGERVSQCPGCKTPYIKDENCEHVTCQNPECGIDFCFRCAAKRSPILAHGNHYHRSTCQDYSKYIGDDKLEPKCTECSANNDICQRPSDLPRPGLFF